ncbi:hypothetical protein GIB67_002348 [Kingdonia uniflora]|uniref:Uncharacterized protein n=1 Tax=Kingdonia uniflora TaxID=39325 RepID=A0A7J7LS35_9MAGN|nr:hypothetical protein GIB67_002348 [Kingdonia uniflora]
MKINKEKNCVPVSSSFPSSPVLSLWKIETPNPSLIASILQACFNCDSLSNYTTPKN